MPLRCSFTVTVSDTEKPKIAGCPSPINQANDPDVCSAKVFWTAPTATDNCGVKSFTSTHNPGYTFPKGATTVTYTAMDTAGNTSTCSFTVTVSDTEKPKITGCPSPINQANDPGVCSAKVFWTAPTATDNCGVKSFTSTHNPGDTFPKGTTTVTYTAKDTAGNTSTCSFTVTVSDTEKPKIAGCPSNINQPNDPGKCSAVVAWPAPTATDNCGVKSFTSTNKPGDTFPRGTTTVMYTAEDSSGNKSYCSFFVTASATERPK